MRVRFWCALVCVVFLLISQTTIHGRVSRRRKTREFLFRRTNSITQRPCGCSTTFSCSCCETVTLIYSKQQGRLCSNFMYQRNGLNVDISLNTDIMKTTTVSVYRPFKICSPIPGTFFSSVCANVVELNEFSRSLTVCVRHEIASKVQEWQIDYTCVSISTELPAATSAATTSGTMTTKIPMMSMAPAMMTMAPAMMTMAPAMMTMAPAMMTMVPAMMTMAPATTTKAPAMVTMAPAMVTMAPAMTTMAPAMTTKAPAMTTTAPAMTTKAPAMTMAPAATGSAQPTTAAPAAPPGGTTAGMGIVGARRKRRGAEKRMKLSRGGDIVNTDDNGRGKIIVDRAVTTTEYTPISTGERLNVKAPKDITASPLGATTSGDAIPKALPVLGESEKNGTWNNGAEHFPSRTPPFIAKQIRDGTFLRANMDNVEESKNSSVSDVIIFPE